MTRKGAIRQGIRAVAAAVLAVCFVFLSGALRSEVARAAIPPAQLGHAIVAVKVGGDRSGPSTIAPLQGVRFGLFTSLPTSYDPFTGFTAAEPINNTWAICTSDSDGDCVFTVRIGDVGQGGVPSHTRLWVAPTDRPDVKLVREPGVGDRAVGGHLDGPDPACFPDPATTVRRALHFRAVGVHHRPWHLVTTERRSF